MTNCNFDRVEWFKLVRLDIIHIGKFSIIGVRFYDCYWDLIIIISKLQLEWKVKINFKYFNFH